MGITDDENDIASDSHPDKKEIHPVRRQAIDRPRQHERLQRCPAQHPSMNEYQRPRSDPKEVGGGDGDGVGRVEITIFNNEMSEEDYCAGC